MKATANPGASGVPGRVRRPRPGMLTEDPVAAVAVVLGLVVLLALAGGVSRTIASGVLLGCVGLVLAAALQGAWRHRRTVAPPVAVLGLIALVIAVHVRDAAQAWNETRFETAAGFGPTPQITDRAFLGDQVDLMLPALLCGSGSVLVFAGVRRAVGWRRAMAGTPWRSLVGAADDDRGRTAARRGVALAGLGASLVLAVLVARGASNLAERYGPGFGDVLASVGLGLLALVVAPGLLAAVVVSRRDRSERELAVHRQAVAAHLHDSVLQTFALIQRNLDDPERVRRLVRTQERELRAWLAGREVDALAATLAGALRGVADVVEEEHGVTIDLDVLDDPAVLERHRPLLEASREALRNAARHGGGAAIRVLAETATDPVPATIVWVRDDGPGFDPEQVDPERRGVRDAIVGRMRAVGGDARIDSTPGAGTEVVLTLPDEPAPRVPLDDEPEDPA